MTTKVQLVVSKTIDLNLEDETINSDLNDTLLGMSCTIASRSDIADAIKEMVDAGLLDNHITISGADVTVDVPHDLDGIAVDQPEEVPLVDQD